MDTVAKQESTIATAWIRTWLEELSTKGSGDDASLAVLVAPTWSTPSAPPENAQPMKPVPPAEPPLNP